MYVIFIFIFACTAIHLFDKFFLHIPVDNHLCFRKPKYVHIHIQYILHIEDNKNFCYFRNFHHFRGDLKICFSKTKM